MNIVITGASAGIGAALARHLGREGHRVIVVARREAELRRVAAESDDAIVAVADVTRRADVDHVRDKAIAALGHVDVWINNAGRGIGYRVLELTDEQFDEIMAVNVKSALYGMQAIVPHFQQRGHGHLINISSYLGRVPLATFRSAYNAAKAALNALTANLRMDLAKDWPDIHVSLVMPGVVTTDFPRNALGGTPAPPPRAGGRPVPTQTPEEVAVMISDLIAHPRAELYTQQFHADLTRRYYDDVEAFERSMKS